MRRVLLFISLFLLFFTIIFYQFKPAVAYAQNYYSPYLSQETDYNVPQNLHTYTQSMLIDFLSAVVCGLAGFDPTSANHQCLGWNGNTNKIGYIAKNGGILGFELRGIAMTYNLPVHTQYYMQYLATNFHTFTSNTYAANSNEVGVGATGLDPLLTIWVGFRNAAYLLIVVIFVVLGLLIMFRIKIDPRTVMTVQNQIPKIVIGLLAITFSFAIAGLLIDLMYVTTYLILNLINSSVSGGIVKVDDVVKFATPFDAANTILPGKIAGATGAAANSISKAINDVLGGLGPLGAFIGVINWIFSFVVAVFQWIGSIAGISSGNVSLDNGGLTQIIIFIVLIVSVLTSLFRFWVALVTCYINILFNIVLGPVRILFGMIPAGPGGGLSGWIKELIANLAVFPASIGFIALAAALSKAVGSGHAFTPYLIPGSDISGVLGFVTILMLPKLPDQVKEWFKVKGGGLGDSVGAGIATGMGVAAAAGRTVGRRLFQRELPLQGQAEGWLRRVALGDPGTPTRRRRIVEKLLGEERSH